MSRSKFVLLALAALASSACATSYQKEGFFTNGYSDSRKSSDRFAVTFRGNEQTSPETAMRYALKRASELTLRHGYRYFAVLEEIDAGKNRHSKNKAHLHYPSVRLVIQCFHDRPLDRPSLDAREYL
jgi:hypothetical protein